jgi:hypothetical protein
MSACLAIFIFNAAYSFTMRSYSIDPIKDTNELPKKQVWEKEYYRIAQKVPRMRRTHS